MWAEGAGVERERRLTTRTPTYIRSYKSISVCVEWDAPLLCQWYSCVTWKKITHLSFCLNGARYMLFDHVHQVFGCALKSRCIHGVELSMLSPKTLFRCVCGDSAGLIQPPIIHPIHHHIINVITSADEMFPAPYSGFSLTASPYVICITPIHLCTYVHPLIYTWIQPPQLLLACTAAVCSLPFHFKQKRILHIQDLFVIALNSSFLVG